MVKQKCCIRSVLLYLFYVYMDMGLMGNIRGHPQITSHLGGREGVLQVVTWCDKGEGGGSLMCDITFL